MSSEEKPRGTKERRAYPRFEVDDWVELITGFESRLRAISGTGSAVRESRPKRAARDPVRIRRWWHWRGGRGP